LERSQTPAYIVAIRPSALGDLEKLPPEARARIRNALDGLTDEPLPSGVVKLRGREDTYRVRIGRYRVIYQVDFREKVITVGRVAHRSDAYR
jgi:mRNA interferase RelE/StbE